METSYCELRKKMVINMVDGSCLGHIIDIIFDTKCGQVCGIVVPCTGVGWKSIFSGKKELFIPSNNICSIGKDVILVETYIQPAGQIPCSR